MKGEEIGLIIVGFFVIAILVGGGLYLYHTSRFNEHSEGNKMMEVKVTNQTPFTSIITTRDETFLSRPGETGILHLARHSDISAERNDGVEFIHRLSNDNVNHLYITPSGFRTNLTSTVNAELVNASQTEILFIQKSLKGGEKIIVQNVPPESTVKDVYIPGRSVWIVSYPSEPDIPISELKLGSQSVTSLVFDGLRLIAF